MWRLRLEPACLCWSWRYDGTTIITGTHRAERIFCSAEFDAKYDAVKLPTHQRLQNCNMQIFKCV